MSQSEKDRTLEKLKLLQDEPVEESNHFQLDLLATQLEGILMDDKLPTPFAIALHGEWGEGKTSLLTRVHSTVSNLVDKDPNNKYNNWNVLWFDAWEYERLDPVPALMQKISHKYKDRNGKFKEAIKRFTFFSLDIALRYATNMKLEEAVKHFESTVEEISTIRQELSEMIGEGRLIVFVDDLDRCHVDNTIGVLEAVKLFLNPKGAVFVVAVDMISLERAWDLRYRGQKTANIEGKDYLDKIFQLKLSLPPKEEKRREEYIKELAASLPPDLQGLIVQGCPPNPRKIKRVLNLIYFLARITDEKTFTKDLPLLVIWAIAMVCYPKLANILKKNSKALFDTTKYVNEAYQDDDYDSFNAKFKPSDPKTVIGGSYFIRPVLTEAFEDMYLYDFLRSIAKSPILEKLNPESFRDIIFRAGLVG